MPIHLAVVLQSLGSMLILYTSILLIPVFVSFYYKEDTKGFIFATISSAILTGVMFASAHLLRRKGKHNNELSDRDAILTTVLFWGVLTIAAAFPFRMILGMPVTDAYFEAASGLTTTGSTVLTGLDSMPKSILIFRQLLQWIGGMGLIVLAVAILPYLSGGAARMYRVELPGFSRDVRMTPRVERTAGWLWGTYVLLTVLCTCAYFFAGMPLFDAIAHALSTVSIGGFSTHDASLAYFNSQGVYLVAIFFMIVSAANFGLHYILVSNRTLHQYWDNDEFRIFILSLVLVCVWVCYFCLDSGNTKTAVIFQTVSHFTTTGFNSVDMQTMPSATVMILLLIACIGPCGGSVGGGIKMVRVLLALRQSQNQLHLLVHPNITKPVGLGGHMIDDRTMDGVWGFLVFYLLVLLLATLVLVGYGLDWFSAYSAVIACLNNLGPGLGEVEHSFMTIPDGAKWVLMLTMIMGRLELMAFLVLFTRAFWRK